MLPTPEFIDDTIKWHAECNRLLRIVRNYHSGIASYTDALNAYGDYCLHLRTIPIASTPNTTDEPEDLRFSGC